MSISVKRIENDLANARLTLNNIKTFEDIKERAANRGVTDERLAEILQFHDESLKALDRYKAEQAAQIGLTDQLSEKEKEAYDFYMECIEIARLAFEDNPGVMELLGLNGRRSKAMHKWTAQALRFFKAALSREDILQDFLKYNLTKENLEKGQPLIEQLLDAKYKQTEQKGKVQASFKVRDNVYKLFRKPMRQLRKVMRIEYKKEPQQLERLGIRVYSAGYVKAETRRKNEERKKKEAEENGTGGQSETEETAAQ